VRSQRSTVLWAVPLVVAALTFTSAATRLDAQVLYGSLVGTVTDQSGAVVPGAQVSATQIQTGQVRQDTTDQSGRYSIVNLLPGTYNVSVDAKGFKKFAQENLTITPNVVSRTDVHLEVGAATEEVTVSGIAAQLQTEKADTHTEITGKSVTNMPLGGYRNYQTLINLAPGAMPAAYQNSITDTPGRALNTHINGGNAQTNITRIDGAESINVWLPHHVGLVVPAETVDVVNVTTGSADADQGLAGTAAITVVTKSGTNDLHGSAFEFHNNQRLNARNFFLTPSQSKPVGIYNNYGGTLGGPIVKNKLFYFVNFDGTNQKTSANGTYTVPTADQRAGIFTASPTLIYDPATGNPDGTGRTAFAGNIVPTNRISPIAQKVQGFFPLPNLPGAANNFAASGGPILDRYYFDTKENWNRNEKHSIWFKYDRMWATAGGKGIFDVAGGPAPGGDPGLGDTTVQVFSLGHTYLLGPTLILDGNVGYQRMVQDVKGTDFGTNYGDQLGIPGLNGPDIRQSGFPNISWGGYYTALGVPSWMPEFRTDESYTTSHSLTWTKGAHQFRFGFDLVRHHLNHWQPELSAGGPRGALDFNGQTTTLKNANGTTAAAANQYNAYAQFLLGYSNEVQKGLQYILMTGREWQFSWFAQDRWQISPKLTVTLGLRYEFYPLMTRAAGKGIERYDPFTNNLYMGGRGDVPVDAGISVSKKLFAPNAGIAYRLNDKTVIRTGYGLNYDPIPFSRPLRGFYPLTINSDTTSPNSFSYASTLDAGIPPFTGPDLSTGIIPLPGNVSERSPWGYINRGYIQSWNFTIERKLPLDLITSVAYVGQKSTHLLADRDINAGFPGSGTTGLPYYARDGRSVPTNMWDGYLNSNYHSLQVAVNRSFSQGLMLKGAYTYSKAIDYTDDDGWASVGWNWGPVFNRNRAAAGFDRTHVFQLGWVYELPFGPNKAHLSTGLASKIVGGWQFSGIEACYTGTPFTVTGPGGSLNAPNNTQTADQVKAVVERPGNVGTTGTYYDTTAFQAVTTQRFGTSGRNILRNPGMWNTDLSIVRIFPIGEKLQLQFRSEFYNLPNTSHFNGVVSSDVSNSNFMRITGSSGERNIRFAFRLQW
jgi:hypothetical protein